MLLVIGSYSVENSIFGVLIMILASAVGVICLRFDWPRIPFLLAVVLGGFAESYLNLSNSIFGSDWVTRPGVLILFAIALLALLVSFRQGHRKGRKSPKSGTRKRKVKH